MHIWTGSQESKLSKIIVERSRSLGHQLILTLEWLLPCQLLGVLRWNKNYTIGIQTSFWRWHHQVGPSLMYACHSWHQILATTQSFSKAWRAIERQFLRYAYLDGISRIKTFQDHSWKFKVTRSPGHQLILTLEWLLPCKLLGVLRWNKNYTIGIQTSFWRWPHQVGPSLMYACHSWHQILATTQSLSLSLSLFSTNSTRPGWLPKCEYIFYNIQHILAFSSSMIW